MKLIIFLAITFFASTIAQGNNQCCPCEDDSDLLDFIVTVPNEINQSNSYQIIYQLINLLINTKIIDYSTASSILITFRIPVPSNFPNGGNALTTVAIYSLQCGGKSDARIKFIQTLTVLYDRPTASGLIKALIELILNNKIASISQVIKININYGCVPNIQIVVPPGKIPTNPNPAPNPNPNPPVNPYPNPAPNPNPNPAPSNPNVAIVPGKPNVDSTVTITQIVSTNDANNLIIYLINLLVQNKIIDQMTGNRLTTTFVSTFNCNGCRPLTANDQLSLTGNQNPKDKFLKVIIRLIGNPNANDITSNVIKALFELLIDNGIVNMQTAVNINVKYGIGSSINQVEFPQSSKITFPADQLKPGTPLDCTVTLTQYYADNLSAYVNRLLYILLNRQIIDIQLSNRILATFGIAATSDYQFNANGAQVLVEREIMTLVVRGNPNPKTKFLNALLTYIQNERPQVPALPLVRMLLELIIDNGIIDVQSGLQMSVAYGFGIKISSLPDRPDVAYPLTDIVAGEIGESTFTVTTVEEKDVYGAVNGLLEILVAKNILDVSAATSILATFKISGRGQFNAAAYGLTVSSVSSIRINANEACRQRFITLLTSLINAPSNTKLVSALLTVLMDSGTINMQTAYNIMMVFRIGGQIQFQPKPKIIEPTLTGGQDPGSNMIIDSTVTINQVVQDVKPLIKRLSELIVNAPLCHQTVANNILTTFNIQTGGSTITANNVGQTVIFSGKVAASQKFIRNLTPLLYNPTASSNLNVLVKIMTEILIDNAIIDYHSAVKFLVAYGVGNNVNVQYNPISTNYINGGRYQK